MKQIILSLTEQAPAHCVWMKIEDDGSSAGGAGPLAELAAGVEGYRLLVLIPSNEVLLTKVALPPGSRKQMLTAIPYALEESLADEVEDQHFAVGPADGEGRLSVAVIAIKRLEYWLGLCQDHGLAPACMTPELLTLPLAGVGRAMLLTANGQALVRTGLQEGFVLEIDSLALLAGMPEISADSPFILYQEGDSTELPEDLLALIVERRRVTDSMVLRAKGLVEKELINLLQGVYTPQAQWERHWRRWRLPAVLLLALLLVQIGIGIRENIRLRHYKKRLDAEIVQVYRQTFPDAQRIVNPRAQMEHQLKTLRGGGDTAAPHNFLDLLGRGGPILAGGGNLQLKSLRYRAGELDLDLEISDIQILDTIRDRLIKQGLVVDIRTATTRGDRVQARMQLKEKNP